MKSGKYMPMKSKNGRYQDKAKAEIAALMAK